MHKPLLFLSPSLGAIATALKTIPQEPVITPGQDMIFTTPEGGQFMLVPVKAYKAEGEP